MTRGIINQILYQPRVKYATTTQLIVLLYHVVMPRPAQAVQQGYLILVGHVISVVGQWPLFIQYTNDVTLYIIYCARY